MSDKRLASCSGVFTTSPEDSKENMKYVTQECLQDLMSKYTLNEGIRYAMELIIWELQPFDESVAEYKTMTELKDYFFKEKKAYEARIKYLEKLLADNNIAEPNVLEKEDE